MTTTTEIPLAAPPQRFFVTLSGVTYSCAVLWRDLAQGWFLDIADDQGNPILSGLAMITGADLLAQYRATCAIPGQLIIATDHDTDAAPTFASLGASTRLYYVSP